MLPAVLLFMLMLLSGFRLASVVVVLLFEDLLLFERPKFATNSEMILEKELELGGGGGSSCAVSFLLIELFLEEMNIFSRSHFQFSQLHKLLTKPNII